MNVDDCIDVLSIPILGIVPEDGAVASYASNGKVIADNESGAGKAFSNIANRISGQSVRIMNFDKKKGLIKQLVNIFLR